MIRCGAESVELREPQGRPAKPKQMRLLGLSTAWLHSSSIANTLVGLQMDGLGADYIQRRVDLLGAVPLDEVQAVARKLLSVEPAILVIGKALDGGKG